VRFSLFFFLIHLLNSCFFFIYSSPCQKQDWPKHKLECLVMKKNDPTTPTSPVAKTSPTTPAVPLTGLLLAFKNAKASCFVAPKRCLPRLPRQERSLSMQLCRRHVLLVQLSVNRLAVAQISLQLGRKQHPEASPRHHFSSSRQNRPLHRHIVASACFLVCPSRSSRLFVLPWYSPGKTRF